jgi:hypothetical protein
MKIRLVLSWLLAIPMFLLLLLFAFCFLGSLLLIAAHGAVSQNLFFVTGSFFYLLCAHLLYFGSYFAYPPFYSNRLRFIKDFLHTKKFLLPLVAAYLISFGYIFHYFKIV